MFVQKNPDYNTKITEIQKKLTDHTHDKYISTPEFNKLTAEKFAARLKWVNLVTKTDFDDKLKSLNLKIKDELFKIELNRLNNFYGK